MKANKIINMYSSKKDNWRGFTITDAAIQQINYMLVHDKNMRGLRLDIKKSGCAGFKYIMNKVLKSDINHDLIYECAPGIKLFVSLEAMPFIDGTALDYVQEGLNHMFKFNNPQSKHTCGCGESFNI